MVYTREQRFAGDGRIFAGMYSDSKPKIFPSKPVEVDDIDNGYLLADQTEGEKAKFKFATGSFVYVVSSGETYLYNAEKHKWVKKTNSGGGGGGGGIDPDDIATDEEIEDIVDDIWSD